MASMKRPLRFQLFNFSGCIIAPNLHETIISAIFRLLNNGYLNYLSMLMQTRTKDDKNRPNVRKKAKMRQAESPAFHWTVAAQPISIGINRSVT